MTNQSTESPAEIAERQLEEVASKMKRETGWTNLLVSLVDAKRIVAAALQAEREANTVDLCENCDGTTEVTNELSGFATVAFCIKCWNKRESEIAAKLQAERERALEAASQAIADHIFTLPDGSLPWGLDSGIDVKGQLIRRLRALAQKGGGA